jgi:uncharacterized protein (TIGR02118 family)
MAVKLNVHFGMPADPAQFERYDVETHAPIARTLPGLRSFEYGPTLSNLDGSAPETFWITTLTFADVASMQAALASSEGEATTADMANFATGSMTVIASEVL